MIVAADVAGHDDHGVLEMHHAALAVGQPAVVQHLQQHVEHVGVGLLDLVEQHHAVGLAPHGLGQLAAFVVADVAGRRADQPRDGVLLHVLRHVDADHARARRRTGTRPARGPARSCPRRSAQGTGTSRAAGSGLAARRAQRRTALATARTASSWPTTRWCSRSSILTSFSTSPSSSCVTGTPRPASRRPRRCPARRLPA